MSPSTMSSMWVKSRVWVPGSTTVSGTPLAACSSKIPITVAYEPLPIWPGPVHVVEVRDHVVEAEPVGKLRMYSMFLALVHEYGLRCSAPSLANFELDPA